MSETDTRAMVLAQHYIEVEQPQRALDALARLSGDEMANPDVWRLRGFAQLALEDHDAAATAARAGLELAPDWIALLYLLSLAEEGLGDLAEAERAILSALDIDPDQPELLCQYADLLLRAGQLDKAERLVERAAALDPDHPNVLRERIALAYLRGDRKAGEAWSQKLLAYDPENAGARSMLGVLAYGRGGVAEATRHFEAAAAQEPQNALTAEAAREMRIANHPALRLMRPVDRIGPGALWIGFIATTTALRAAGLTSVLAVVIPLWLVFVVYSWTAPWLVRQLVERERIERGIS